MITGYTAGTEVKWNEDNSLVTGVIEATYYKPTVVEIEGEPVKVDVSSNSPTYLIHRLDDGRHCIMAHTDVMLKSTNLHT